MKKSYRFFIFSLIILNIFNFVITQETDYGIPQIVKYLLSVIFLFSLFYLFRDNYVNKRYHGLMYFIISIFIIWSLFLLVLSPINSVRYIQSLFAHPYYFVPYLIPIILLFTKFETIFFRFLMRVSFVLSIILILTQAFLLFRGIDQIGLTEDIAILDVSSLGLFLLLMISHLYYNKWVFRVAFLSVFLSILILAILGRRGAFANYVYALFFLVVIRIKSRTIKSIYKGLYIFLVATMLFGLVISFTYLTHKFFIFERGFSKEAWEISRGLVLEDFFLDFDSKKDWIFGRGLNGTILRTINNESVYGTGIENGFLMVLLKGGLLYLVPMVLIFLRASYLGFYKSNNDLTKALAALIIIQIFSMFSFGLPAYTSTYVLVWISVSACFSEELRYVDNETLMEILN